MRCKDNGEQLSFVEDFWNEVEQGLSGATKDELTTAIEKCRTLVLQTQPFSPIRKCLITRLVELRRQLYDLQVKVVVINCIAGAVLKFG
ncbi:unnamed protein product [Soboliphyme baturini]|uniref:FH2 domain-containing protein n=1 Tax=Soboliphyme baturini TaxID=241478 RepID=A0A183JAI6_9BILA|nr:unnamed protein product [Soboliphyme baturini]